MSTAVDSPSATSKPIETPTVDAKNSEGKATPAGEKPTKKRVKKKSKRQPRKNTLKTKVVVRRLPPNLPEKIFFNAVKPWISEETTDYSLYVPGKLSKRYTDDTFSIITAATEVLVYIAAKRKKAYFLVLISTSRPWRP